MQHDSNVETPQAEISNAVLTPEKNHPNFFKKKTSHTLNIRRLCSKVQPMPLNEKEILQRQQWVNHQKTYIAFLPSTAVLGA